MKTKQMVVIAIFASLSIVLSMIKVWQMANGGSISLYLVPLMFVAFKTDFKSTLLCCTLTSIVQIILSGYVVGFFQVFLDYILPVCAISLLSIVRNRNLFTISITSMFVGILMLSSYVISGMIYFKTPFIGSLIYNATFFIPTFLISIIIISILNKFDFKI
ncbi:MAG: energy-coupled thiamine transporter ThiT [Bacilli bacterium]